MSAALKDSWHRADTWFSERPVRERALIIAVSVVLLLAVGWELAVTPVINSNSVLESRMRSLDQEQASLTDQQQLLTARLASDPSRELRDRLAARQASLDRLDAELAAATGKLIAPRGMVRLLQDMLIAQKALELVGVELLAPTPIFDQQKGSEITNTDSQAAEPLLYAHDVELVIRGNYLDVLDYLETLEGMDDRLGWVSLDYRMLEYPTNEIRIRVRTLSLDRAWLGV